MIAIDSDEISTAHDDSQTPQTQQQHLRRSSRTRNPVKRLIQEI